MKTGMQLKKPYGKAIFSRVRNARYLGWEDAFDVEFADGLCFLEPHATIRKANRISTKAVPVSVEVDDDLGSHFRVTYDNGQVAEVSWAFIRELPPRIQPRRRTPRRLLCSVGLLLILVHGWCLSARAQVNSDSNGSDGAFDLTANTVLNMADNPNVVYHYTSVNISKGVTVSVNPNANNMPVVC